MMAALFLALWANNRRCTEDDVEFILTPWVYRTAMGLCFAWILLMAFCITSMLGVQYR